MPIIRRTPAPSAQIWAWGSVMRRQAASGSWNRSRLLLFLRQVLLACSCFYCTGTFGQVEVRIVLSDTLDGQVWRQASSGIKCKKCTTAIRGDTLAISLRDSFAVRPYLQNTLFALRSKGYLAASLDGAESQVLRLHLGPAYSSVLCRVEADSQIRTSFLRACIPDSTTRLSAPEVAALQAAIFTALENSGYPFAQVRTQLEPGTDSVATITVRPGRRLIFGTPQSDDYPTYFLRQITRFTKGEWYSHERIARLETELRRQNEWVILAGKPKLVFVGDEVKLNLPLKPAQPNRFDFILGLLPNPITGRSTITGTLDARLFNALKAAEMFSVHFERLRPLNQQLDVQARIPYLFMLPFGASGQIQMYRRDSAFLDVSLRAGLLYQMQRGQLELFWSRNSSDLLKIDTQQILNTLRLPTTLDLNSNQFALAYTLKKFDNRFNPRRGIGIQTEARVGLVQIIRSATVEQLRRPDLPDFDFSSLYDTLRVQGNRYQFLAWMDGFLPIGRQATLRAAIRAGMLTAGASVLRNELYRLGGFELVRGFDEDIFFASAYANGILEMRLLTGERSFFSVFGEYSALNLAEASGTAVLAYPAALGAGLQIETRGGVFGLSMAIGKLGKAAFDFRSPKIHLGYLSQL